MRERRGCSCILLICFVAILVVPCTDAAVSRKVRSKKEDPTTTSHSFDVVGITIHREVDPLGDEREPLEMPPRIDSEARRAATRPIRVHDDDIHGCSTRYPRSNSNRHRMKDHSLAQRVKHLAQQKSNQQTSFQHYLLKEMQGEHQSSSVAHPTMVDSAVTPFLGSVVGISAFLAISSWIQKPLSGQQSLWKTVWAHEKLSPVLAVAWLPWVLGVQPTKFKVLDLLLILIPFIVQQPTLLPYVQYNKILPLMAETLQAMLVAELWKRTWKWFFAQWDDLLLSLRQQSITVVQDDTINNNNNDVSEWKRGYYLVWPTKTLGAPPSWMLELHSFLEESVRGGIKHVFKKSIQEAIHSSWAVWWKTFLQQ
jgi:hypothetical protein